MASCRDVEVALHLVHVQTPKQTTAIREAPSELRRLGELRFPRSSNNIVDMLLSEALLMLMVSLSGDNPSLGILTQPMSPLLINPLTPPRRIPFQHIAS